MLSFCLMIMMMMIRGFLAPGRTIWTMGMHDHTYILLMAIRMVRMGEEGGDTCQEIQTFNFGSIFARQHSIRFIHSFSARPRNHNVAQWGDVVLPFQVEPSLLLVRDDMLWVGTWAMTMTAPNTRSVRYSIIRPSHVMYLWWWWWTSKNARERHTHLEASECCGRLHRAAV